jgi:transcriptional regulator with XRE-family HTH domain
VVWPSAVTAGFGGGTLRTYPAADALNTHAPLAAGFRLLAIVAYPDHHMSPAMKDDLRDEIEHRWRDLGEFIREQRRVTHLSLRKLSEMAGVSNPYLSQIERGMRKPSADILQQIARALEISAETLYVRAGILDERPAEGDLASEIRRDPHLNEEQKKALLRIYWSFRHENGDDVPVEARKV